MSRGRGPIDALKRCTTLLAVLFATGVGALAAQDYEEDAAWLVRALELRANSVVADVGAGDGELTILIAPQVLPNGRVFASELGDESVEDLRDAVEGAGVTNVTIVSGHPERTNLPAGCCDAVFLRNVYHHFDDPLPMNASLLESLKPGGRLAVIDFAPRGGESAEPEHRDGNDHHGVSSDTVAEELREAGFTIVSAEQRSGRRVFVVARKPTQP